MSGRAWLSNDPLAGFLVAATIAACLIGIGYELGSASYPQADAEYYEGDPEHTRAKPSVASAAASKQGVFTKSSKSLCSHPANRDEYDTCQQWRMAEAAKEQVYWTRRQYVLTILEAITVAGAFLAAVFAAYYAKRAADATEGTVDVTRDMAATELRAYISLSHTPDGLHQTNLGLQVRVNIRNWGNTPANVTSAKLTIKSFLTEDDVPVLPDYSDAYERARGGFTLQAGGKFGIGLLFEDRTLDDLQMGSRGSAPPFTLVYGYADYIDVFGVRHRARYARYLIPYVTTGNNLGLFTKRGWNVDYNRQPV